MKILLSNPRHHQSKNFWCVYSHYDRNGIVASYVVEALKKIKSCGFNIIFVTTSPNFNQSSIDLIKNLCAFVIIRENKGYDFGSYKTGIKHLRKFKIDAEKILITNDSVFGPFSSLKKIIKKSDSFDIYGLTDSIDISYHIQSYFIIYNKKVLNDPSFDKFWTSVKLLSTEQSNFKQKIINDYEVGGSQHFMKRGFDLGVEYSYKKIAAQIFNEFFKSIENAESTPNITISKFHLGHNLTHDYWKKLAHQKFPYLKRELLTTNPTNTDLSDWPSVLKTVFNYDSTDIIEAIAAHTDSFDFAYTSNPSETIVKSFKSDQNFKLKINPNFKEYANQFNLKKVKLFKFDEQYYLSCNLDVKASVEIKESISGLDHFLKYGHLEKRRYKLISI